MKKKKIKIGLIFGGVSSEHEVSLVSARSVLKALDKKGLKYSRLLDKLILLALKHYQKKKKINYSWQSNSKWYV